MTSKPKPHCAAAQRILAALDNELQENAKRRGKSLSWSAGDIELRNMLADSVDRRERIQGVYDSTTDAKVLVKLSCELRQLETKIARLLATIKTDVPQPETLTTVKARNAINTRWQRERERNAAGN